MALIPLTSYSQDNKKKQFTVAGVVIDKTGEPLPGTTIYVKNAPGVGTSADMDGKFSIKVDANQILVIQAIGMKSIEKLVTKDEMTLKVTLEEDDTKLDEVVVTGMTSQKKISVVGAISTIDVAQLSTPGTSLNNMIGGRLAGVITMQSSGEARGAREHGTSGVQFLLCRAASHHSQAGACLGQSAQDERERGGARGEALRGRCRQDGRRFAWRSSGRARASVVSLREAVSVFPRGSQVQARLHCQTHEHRAHARHDARGRALDGLASARVAESGAGTRHPHAGRELDARSCARAHVRAEQGPL